MSTGVWVDGDEIASLVHTGTVNLSRSDVIAVLGVTVAIVAIVVTVLATRRYGTRRRRLHIDHHAAPMINTVPGYADPKLKVTYEGEEIVNPHLVTLRIINLGPTDITASHFHEGDPLVVTLNCRSYAITGTPYPDSTTFGSLDDGTILLGPRLMKKGEEWIVEVVVSGSPLPTVTSPLVDTDIVDREFAEEVERFAEGTSTVIGHMLAGGPMAAVLADLAKTVGQRKYWLARNWNSKRPSSNS